MRSPHPSHAFRCRALKETALRVLSTKIFSPKVLERDLHKSPVNVRFQSVYQASSKRLPSFIHLTSTSLLIERPKCNSSAASALFLRRLITRAA